MVKRRRKKTGGWKASSGLQWKTVKEISALAHEAEFNVRLDIMPRSGTDAERKRSVSRVVAHLGQALKRRGREHIGVTTYEKSDTVDLHGHHLTRIEPKDRDLIAKYDGSVTHVITFPARERADRVNYATKQRLPFSPEYEKNSPHKRQAGAPIKGPRVSYTGAAKLIVEELESRHQSLGALTEAQQPKNTPSPEPKRANCSALKPVGQLSLFPEMEKPIARLSAFTAGTPSPSVALEIEHRRRMLGLSQRELGQKAGLSQPQIANVLLGRFGFSRLATSRIKSVLLSQERFAA